MDWQRLGMVIAAVLAGLIVAGGLGALWRADRGRRSYFPWLRGIPMSGVARLIRNQAVAMAVPETERTGGWIMWMMRDDDGRTLRLVVLVSPGFDTSPATRLPRRDWMAFVAGSYTALEITGRTEREVAAGLWRRAMAARDAGPKEESDAER